MRKKMLKLADHGLRFRFAQSMKTLELFKVTAVVSFAHPLSSENEEILSGLLAAIVFSWAVVDARGPDAVQ